MKKPRRVLFVTVGTTAVSASNLGALGEDAADLRKDAEDFLKGTEPAPDFFQRVLDAHETLWRSGLPIFQNRYGTSAEMASSWYALRLQDNEHLFDPDQDRIVLLASDTPQGRFCAAVNERLMREYLFSPACRKQQSTCVEVIEGLEAKDGGFACNIVGSIEAIWIRHQASEQTIVNITGGFKGTVPAITWRCMHTEKCSMFYTHESMDRAETITFSQGAQPQYATRPIII
jgi:putative CRISPR-associated protein (TIGR02619 family)